MVDLKLQVNKLTDKLSSMGAKLEMNFDDEDEFLKQYKDTAKERGLQYVEKKAYIDHDYKGYISANGKKEGRGVEVWNDGEKYVSEYHQGK